MQHKQNEATRKRSLDEINEKYEEPPKKERKIEEVVKDENLRKTPLTEKNKRDIQALLRKICDDDEKENEGDDGDRINVDLNYLERKNKSNDPKYHLSYSTGTGRTMSRVCLACDHLCNAHDPGTINHHFLKGMCSVLNKLKITSNKDSCLNHTCKISDCKFEDVKINEFYNHFTYKKFDHMKNVPLFCTFCEKWVMLADLKDHKNQHMIKFLQNGVIKCKKCKTVFNCSNFLFHLYSEHVPNKEPNKNGGIKSQITKISFTNYACFTPSMGLHDLKEFQDHFIKCLEKRHTSPLVLNSFMFLKSIMPDEKFLTFARNINRDIRRSDLQEVQITI